MDIEWMLTEEQMVNILPKIKSALKWMDRLNPVKSYDFEVKLNYYSNFGEWWLHIHGYGRGVTYTITENKKHWKQI